MGLLIYTIGCNPDDKNDDTIPSLKVTLNDPTDITETSFVANWSVNKTNIQSCQVEVSMQSDFANILKTVTVNDPMMTSQLIDGLNGATKYYHKIKVTLDDGTSGQSEIKSLATNYHTEEANVSTSDGINISGQICYLQSIAGKRPGIIFLGVLGLPNLWKAEEVFQNLIASGYICYKFDWRGQGTSDYWPIPQTEDSVLVYVTQHAVNDMSASYTYLNQHEKVDNSKIALVGGSLGAVESLKGNNWAGVVCSVALSGSRFGLNLEEPLKNILLIAGEQDENSALGWNYADEARSIYESAEEPKKLVTVPGGEHALELLALNGINQEVLDWIYTRMED